MQEFHFPNWVNKFTMMTMGGIGAGGGYVAICLYFAVHPTTVNVGHAPEQPVPYSHKLHVGELGLDCKYCHNTVDKTAHAAIPPTATCGNCHGGHRYDEMPKGDGSGELETRKTIFSAVHLESDKLKPIRDSLENNESVPWVKVHDLPDFVYFNHSAHVNRGVGCVECHGRVDKMEVVTQVETLSMKFCLDCHRNPDERLRPLEFVTKLDWQPAPGEDRAAIGRKIREELGINPNTSCSTCHR